MLLITKLHYFYTFIYEKYNLTYILMVSIKEVASLKNDSDHHEVVAAPCLFLLLRLVFRGRKYGRRVMFRRETLQNLG